MANHTVGNELSNETCDKGDWPCLFSNMSKTEKLTGLIGLFIMLWGLTQKWKPVWLFIGGFIARKAVKNHCNAKNFRSWMKPSIKKSAMWMLDKYC